MVLYPISNYMEQLHKLLETIWDCTHFLGMLSLLVPTIFAAFAYQKERPFQKVFTDDDPNLMLRDKVLHSIAVMYRILYK